MQIYNFFCYSWDIRQSSLVVGESCRIDVVTRMKDKERGSIGNNIMNARWVSAVWRSWFLCVWPFPDGQKSHDWGDRRNTSSHSHFHHSCQLKEREKEKQYTITYVYIHIPQVNWPGTSSNYGKAFFTRHLLVPKMWAKILNTTFYKSCKISAEVCHTHIKQALKIVVINSLQLIPNSTSNNPDYGIVDNLSFGLDDCAGQKTEVGVWTLH